VVLLRQQRREDSNRPAVVFDLGENMEKQQVKPERDLTQELKQLYFHAGRFSAGARDFTARDAYHEYNRRESANTRKVR
jgi:hypothetical protein